MPAFQRKPRLIIDTREQRPYEFQRFTDRFESIERAALVAGDYSLEGMTKNIAIERKSLQDLVSTLTAGRDRFKRELARLQVFDYKCIVIEATLKEVSMPYSFSKASPNSILGSIDALEMTYGVPFKFYDNRALAEERIVSLLTKFWGAHNPTSP